MHPRTDAQRAASKRNWIKFRVWLIENHDKRLRTGGAKQRYLKLREEVLKHLGPETRKLFQ